MKDNILNNNFYDIENKEIKILEEILIELRNKVEIFAFQDEQFLFYFDYYFSRFCANMSYLVFLKLKENGFNNVQFILNNEHAFVLLNNNIIIDLTATQFSHFNINVLILHKDDFIDKEILERHSDIFSIETICNNENDIQNALKKWPKEQNCFYFLNNCKWYNDIIYEINKK